MLVSLNWLEQGTVVKKKTKHCTIDSKLKFLINDAYWQRNSSLGSYYFGKLLCTET